MQRPTSQNRECSNCGNELMWTESHTSKAFVYSCSVCHYEEVATVSPTASQKSLTTAEMANQLKNLLKRAHADHIESEEIINILRAEIEFEAEMGHLGRRVLVQIIDLGFQETNTEITNDRNSRETLHNHGTN
ncbi:MAG: hypothetical protein HXX08_07555 [Chloroflexi bacterium]|uniref:Uncharacterized protein n=1 Tax=Candidatus Chlorohelix allophototropha TaxID=3003348 RepID=A0A8T7LUK6_9CHLR|nr:hypothetical protein [Chloroflexota bacterium]WJW67587.1 hypothetical protein OZ401_000856 [Chloroflexota bacterium L227-S17]